MRAEELADEDGAGNRVGLWKCRAVENAENQTAVSRRFPPRLEIANTAITTFPQARRLGLSQPKRPPGAFTDEIPCSIRAK